MWTPHINNMEFQYEAGWAQSWCGCFGEEINILPLPGIEPSFSRCPASSLATIPNMLSQLFAE
jgi:hypothetical protein